VAGVPTLFAPAKLTTTLRITGVRADGYHLIDAEMVSLDFGDELEVDPDGRGFEVDRGYGPLEGDPDDLVPRALELAGLRARVLLHKRVPSGAGLGGGSADAAAILRWAGMHDESRAVVLGADVPFCLLGGRARVRGIGERVEPLAFEERVVTLFTPPIHCSTPEVYGRWDDMGGPEGEYGNDLEPAAVDLVPDLVRWRSRFAAATGEWPRLAGSGSTWWVDGEHPGPGHVVARTIPPML
jgi:4-diphosphocytidyl-2-C-methyl-D-erythritol kinase